MQESQEHYFEEDSLYKAINRFEDMIRARVTSYFDVYEFEIIVDYYLDQHHFSKAEEALNIALKQHPAAQELKYRLAQLYINSGKPSKGMRLLRDIESLERNNSDFHLLKGTALNSLGKKEESAMAFNEAISLSTDSKDDVIFNIAISYVNNRRYKEAISYLKLAIEINPNNIDALQELALVYERIDELEQSIVYYKKYLDINPFSDSVWLSLGAVYASLDNKEKAIGALEFAIAVRPDNVAALFSKANICVNVEDYDEAIKTYYEILECEPDNIQAYSYIGECYEKKGLYKRSTYFFKRALSINDTYADAWYGLGIATYQQELIEESIEFFNKALEIDPENPDFWFILGEVHRKLGNIKKAAESFNRTVELDPNDFEGWACRAELSFQDNKDIKGAIEILEQGIEYNKDNSTLNYQLATYLFLNGQFKLAVLYFEKGLQLNYPEHDNFIELITKRSARKIALELITKYKK